MTPAIAIIPAHNEGPRVAAVIAPLLASGRFSRILVVDDGSTDDTVQAARAAGAWVLSLTPNRGKGQAMLEGLRATQEPVVAFFDADLIGLSPEHAGQLVDPVARGEAVMVCGLRDYGERYNRLQVAIPPITGERAVLRSVLDQVPLDFWNGFRVEAGINAAAAQAGRVATTVLHGLKIVPKWHKVGVERGILDAARMTREVLTAMRDARSIQPAGQAAAPAVQTDATGRIVGVDGMLNQIAEALAQQARPIITQDILPALQRDTELQRVVGEAAGRGAANSAPVWIIAGSMAILAIAAVAYVTRDRP